MAVVATLRASTLERPKETDTATHMCPTKDHLHHIPPQTHAHKRHKLLGTWTFPSGAMSVSGERNQNPDPPRCLQAKQLAGFRDINSPEMLVILNPRALVDTRRYWCDCFCLFRFHPLLLGGAIAVGCPINTGRVRVLWGAWQPGRGNGKQKSMQHVETCVQVERLELSDGEG